MAAVNRIRGFAEVKYDMIGDKTFVNISLRIVFKNFPPTQFKSRRWLSDFISKKFENSNFQKILQRFRALTLEQEFYAKFDQKIEKFSFFFLIDIPNRTIFSRI